VRASIGIVPCAELEPHAFLLLQRARAKCGSLLPALILVSTLSFSIVGNAAEPNEAEIDQGREIYGELCLACHGRDMINPGALTFDLRQFPKDQFERFRDVVLNGKPPSMPPWRDKTTNEDINLLWAYVRSGG
jgi:mono/diheme cytochrome c family protein